MTGGWPTAEIDNVRRLRVMAGAVPGAVVSERVIAASFTDVWALLGDFTDGFTRVQPDMRRVRVVEHTGDRVVLHAVSARGPRAVLAGTVRPGWCWLQSRFLIIGMAATPEPDGRTRVALTGGVRVPGMAAIVPVGVRREARRSLDRVERILASG